jgi:thiamine-monophosphate kinase
MKLIDLGERTIIDEILFPRYDRNVGIPRFGDDCAFILELNRNTAGILIATTDPCPQPMATFLGFTSLYYWGWLLSAINLSDIAAAGGRPLGLLTSLILPNETEVDDFVRLLDGIDDCCHLCDTSVVGGNLKEGPSIDLTATALAICHNSRCVSRIGCESGDSIIVIGELGNFWAGVLATKYNLDIEPKVKEFLLKNVLKPTPKVHIGYELARRNLMNSCIDNSDGLYPSLLQLATANNVRMDIIADNMVFIPEIQSVSRLLGIEPVNLIFGWGDWQLIGCTNPRNLSEIREIVKEHDTQIHEIGHVNDGKGVYLTFKGKTRMMPEIDSQRFTSGSFFTSGIDSYIDDIVNLHL